MSQPCLHVTSEGAFLEPCVQGSALSRELERATTITPTSEFAKKKGLSQDFNAFALCRRPDARRLQLPRGFALQEAARRGWTIHTSQLLTPQARVFAASAGSLRELQYEICYHRFVPALCGVGTLAEALAQEKETREIRPVGGVVVLPCGYGKTRCVAEVATITQQRLLFVPPNGIIGEQSVLAFMKFLPGCRVVTLTSTAAPSSKKLKSKSRVVVGFTAKKKQCRRGEPDDEDPEDEDEPVDTTGWTATHLADQRRIDDADIVICAAPTLKAKRYPPAFYAQFGATVFDEAHRMCARGYAALLMQIHSPILLGITAEFERADGTYHVLHHCLGPALFEKRERDLGQERVTVRKVSVTTAVARRLFAENAAAVAAFCGTTEGFGGSPNFGATLTRVLGSLPFLELFAGVLEHARDEFPEDQSYLAHVSALRADVSPIAAPELCSLCERECSAFFRAGCTHDDALVCVPCTWTRWSAHADQCPFCDGASPGLLASCLQRREPQTEEEEEEEEASKKPKSKSKKAVATKSREELEMERQLEAARKCLRMSYFGRNQILVLCERVEPLCLLANALNRRLVGAHVTTHTHPESVVGVLAGAQVSPEDQVRARAKQFVFATNPRAKEGMDIPTLRQLFFLSPMKRTNQPIGRILRDISDEKFVYDWVYPQGVFCAQYFTRLKQYRAWKYIVRPFRLDRWLPGAAEMDSGTDAEPEAAAAAAEPDVGW